MQDDSDVITAFGNLEWSGWEEAELSDVLLDLRQSPKLRVPPEWEAAIPAVDFLKGV